MTDSGSATTGTIVPGSTSAHARSTERDWTQAWTQALVALELDVDQCESLLRAIHSGSTAPDDDPRGSWAPPTDLGPLPESLEERARMVLARQLDVAGELAAAAAQSRQQMAWGDRLDVGATPTPPIYVDAVF